MQHRSSLFGIVFVAVAWTVGGVSPLHAQIDQWANSPQPAEGRQVVPFMEGWYDNGDGTYTISFGYLNRNPDQVIDIPHGERNYIEPARFDGLQPTHFLGSRQRGMFAVTVPESFRDQDLWWYLVDEDGNEYKVPGRARAAAYQLDWLPRPHGSLAPRVWFDAESEAAQGPEGIWSDDPLRASVGSPVTLAIDIEDPSERDPADRRVAGGVPVRIVWSKYQGPAAEVTFARHELSPPPAADGPAPPPEEVELEGVEGTARVVATFSAPGEYVILAQVDNWGAPDSSAGDQCCWTNAYQRVVVTP